MAMYVWKKYLIWSLLSPLMPCLFLRKLISITWNLTSWVTQDKLLNLSFPLVCWPSSVMLTHFDNGGLSEPWYMTSGTAKLQFIDSTWALDLPTYSFVSDHSSNTLSANTHPTSPRAWHLFKEHWHQYPTFSHVKLLFILQNTLCKTCLTPLPFSLSPISHYIIAFLQHSVYTSTLTQIS